MRPEGFLLHFSGCLGQVELDRIASARLHMTPWHVLSLVWDLAKMNAASTADGYGQPPQTILGRYTCLA